MTFKTLIAAILVSALIVATAFADVAKPVPGWNLTGSNPSEFEAGIVPGAGQNRGPAAFLKSKGISAKGFGTLMQQFGANDFRSKRVRLSAAVRAEDVKRSGLWMRVDGETNYGIAFDNMQDRPIAGNTGWQRYDVVLDVPVEAKIIAMGVLLADGGRVWLDDVRFEVVPDSIPTTGSKTHNPLPNAPVNLGFNQP